MAPSGEENEYELLRAAKIAENRAKLAQLGLVEASQALATLAGGHGVMLEAGTEAQPRKKRRVAREAEPVVLKPTRQSGRLRGEAAPSLQQATATAAAEAAAAAEEAAALGPTRQGTSRRALVLDGATYVAPFSLWSIGVTVWDLGRIHRGAWAHRYWSSSGCLFHHAYPVGYRASKVQFGRTYEMSIEEGPTGPVFKVMDQKTGIVFNGPSPTKPWTDVCLAHKTGQRISGPLFFGFSDVATQRAIAGLYNPRELQAALQGERAESEEQSVEERAAREFQGVDGIGEAVGMALALTTQLGGTQHNGLASLRAWVRESEANAEQLREFLVSSTELPEATRKWPAWRHRLVPRILVALASDCTATSGGSGGSEGGRSGAPEGDRGTAAPAAQARPGMPGGARAAARTAAALGQQGTQKQHEQHSEEVDGKAARARGSRAAAGTAAGAQGGSKENRPGNSSRASGPAATAAAGAQAPSRASGRQRKANSKYWGEHYVVEVGE